MDDFKEKDMEEALQAMTSMISRTENAKEKFAQGTSQNTLQKNRLKALYIGSSLISKEMGKIVIPDYTIDDLENAIAPIASLISKSEKAQKKLRIGTWQHTMLGNNLKALYMVSTLLTKRIEI